jgi:hypothetical protein
VGRKEKVNKMKLFGKILKETAVVFNFLYFGVITENFVENLARKACH